MPDTGPLPADHTMSAPSDEIRASHTPWWKTTEGAGLLSLIGVVATALAGVGVAVINSSKDHHSAPPASTSSTAPLSATMNPVAAPTLTPPPPASPAPVNPVPEPANVSIQQVTVDPLAARLFIKGHTNITSASAVEGGSILVLVGPRPDGNSEYWAAQVPGELGGTWTAVIDTPPKLPTPYLVEAFYRPYRPGIDVRPVVGLSGGLSGGETDECSVIPIGVCLRIRYGPPAVYRSPTPPS